MTDQVEQGGQPSQDLSQTAAPSAPPSSPPTTDQFAQAPASAPASTPPAPGPAPWSADLEQFDPAVRGQVDAYIRSNWQPRMTQYEQQVAQAQEATQLYDAYQADPHAANIAVNRQLYGDEYADQLAASLGRTDQMVNPAAVQQQQPMQHQQWQQPQEPQRPNLAGDPTYDYWTEKREQEQYDEAVDSFLADPQYADIQKDLFHAHLKGAETWDDAVASYRNYAAHWAQTQGQDPSAMPPQPPPTIGSQAGGTVGSTPAIERRSLSDEIDAMFAEAQPIAPPTLGSQ